MYDILKNIWKNPGPAFSPMPFWFWNDTLDAEELLRQVDDFHKKGVDGFVIHPRLGFAGVDYLSEEYFDLVALVCEAAQKRRMNIVLYDEGMYPSGSAHGAVVKEDPRFAARRLYAAPEGGEIPENEELCFRVYIKKDEKGLLTDTAFGPAEGYEGYDLILGYTNGTIRGLSPDEDDNQPSAPKAADLLNPAATEVFIKNTHEKYRARLAEFFGQTIVGFFTDEPSMTGRCQKMNGGIIWSYNMMEEFMDAGGDFAMLTALLFEPKDKKLRREAEYCHQKALRARLNQAFYAPLSKWCKANNVALMGHPAESRDCDTMEYFDIPGQDLVWRMVEPGTELTSPDSVMAKCASDFARHNGRSRNSNEVFGVCGESGNPWNFTPDDMMFYLNFLFARGCNMIIPHAFYYSVRTPVQSNERPPDVGPNNIWWKDYKQISAYIRRMSWLNASGTNNPHCAVLCSPEYMPYTPVRELYQQGWTFNYLSLDDLMNKAAVEGDTIRMDRYIYDTILIDGRLRLNSSIVKKIGAFITAGGKMYRGSDFAGYMNKNGRKTTYFEGETGGNLRFTHITKSGTPFFLLINEGNDTITGRVITDLSGAAERFDPFTGKTEPMEALLADGGFAYPVTVHAHSAVVIGMNMGALPTIGEEKPAPRLTEIASLADGRMTFDYHPAEGRFAKLTFEAIHDIADVKVNGESAARLLFKPYECDITALLHDGENTVEVDVTPSMANTYGKPVKTGFDGAAVRIFEA
ncbi:MAG: hypothetical protein IJ497_01485 [Clostridia bacterium]|nr:hypothetical protein [Clostridia bacterium]